MMKILVRLPNWLGDMVMAVGALHQLPVFFPGAQVSVIAKKGIHELLPFFPPVQRQFVFDKEANKGPRGLWAYGKQIRTVEKFDLFFSFPNSFSAALMGFATGAKLRVGFKNEARNMLLTQAYAKPVGLHRAEEYVRLVELYAGKQAGNIDVRLHHTVAKEDVVILNINSEASSRRLTVAKAVEIITAVRRSFSEKILLIGGRGEKEFVQTVYRQLRNKKDIENIAGTTNLHQLTQVLAAAKWVLSTDSGPAHLANALGTHTVVLFGAGNENNTAPYNKEARQIIRLGKLSCEPCTKNVCVQFDTPQCLELLETTQIISILKRIEQPG